MRAQGGILQPGKIVSDTQNRGNNCRGGSGRQWVARGVDNWFVQGKANGETMVGLLSAVMAGKGGVRL
jgi:hypothetical protein